ncbi:MAG: hypothetical protein J6Y90_00735, partial [Lachnospiraceae bacterium]|nr:hypothetical protein [Lachnospiraceae bacterium]
MEGPGEENLIQKGDTNLYHAKPYTMVIRDGDKGDVTYYSSGTGKHVSLGDNDYTYTKLSISLSNWDGYKDGGVNHKLSNTAYSSWNSVEVYARRKGKLSYYKLTDVYITSSASKTINLPEDTAAFEIRYNTFYWSSSLVVDAWMQINPTSHVKTLVRSDYNSKIYSYIYNHATMRAVSNETGEDIRTWRNEDYISLTKSKTGLRVSKGTGSPINDKNHSIETMWVTVTGRNHNSAGRTKAIYTGVFYELLPIGTSVEEDSVKVYTGQTASETNALSRNMYNVTFVPDWKGTGQYMMVVSFGVPETIKAGAITMGYTLTNTYENIQAYGATLDLPSAFINTTSEKLEYELLPKEQLLNKINRGELIFGDLETQYGEYVAYAPATAKFLDINVFSSRFDKTVKTLNTFVQNADIVPDTRYEYRLQYGQSINSQSDNLIIYDILDRGSVISTDPDVPPVVSAWQGEFKDIQIPNIKSSLNNKYCAPVVYYSTTAETDINRLPKDLTNPIWSTTRPSGTVTAIAIDLSKATDGSDFVLRASDTALIYISMESPADENLVGTAAVNTAVSISNLYGLDETSDQGSLKNTKSQTTIMMKPVIDILTLTSNPASGTKDAPALMAYKDMMEYDLTIQNTDTEFNYHNLMVEDTLPTEVSLDESNIYVYINDDKADDVKIGSSPRVAMTKGADGKLTFTVHELRPGEKIHIVLPCSVNTKEGKFENSAVLTSINGLPREEHTDTTYHEVKRYDVFFGKKILGKNPEEFLAGAMLELTDSSGQAEDRWTSSATAGSEYHKVRIGAGEYYFRETEAPDNYAQASRIAFKVSLDGFVTLEKQEQPLADRIIDMYDKYYAVDTVIENHVSGEGANLDKEFSYTATITGLRARRTYKVGSSSYTADGHGDSSFTFKLKHGESITFEKMPTGAHMVVTQAATDGSDGDYTASYAATALKDGNETALHSREVFLRNQELATDDTMIDIDRGVVYIRFENKIMKGLPVRFIVVDDSDGKPVPGMDLKITEQDPISGDKRFESEWITNESYKLVYLPYDSVSELTQIMVPEEYAASEVPLVLSVDSQDNLTCSDGSVVSKDKDGYVVTIRSKKKAKLTVENFASNTAYYLKGATIELWKGERVESASLIKTWVSKDNSGELMYLDRGQAYIIRKTASPNNYVAVLPIEVHLNIGDDASITADVSTKAKVFNSKSGVLTLYDRYVETLVIKNTVTWQESPGEYRFNVSNLTPGDKYVYKKDDGNGGVTSGELTVNEEGKVSFILNGNETITINDLPHDLTVTEEKPGGTYYITDWVMDKTTALPTDDYVDRSTAIADLTGKNTIEVVNKPAVVRVKNKAAGSDEWSEWQYFEAFTTSDKSGAFDYANTLDGEVVIETLMENHASNTLTSGFEFDNKAITSLTIQSSENLTQNGKHSHLECGTNGSMLTFNTGGPVYVNNLEFDGNGHTQNSNGGAINVASGQTTLSNVQIHDFNTSGKGAAVNVGDNASLTVSGGAITNNRADAVDGGAINTGVNSRVYFEGDVVVKNNKDSNGNQKNVVLDQDSNTVIQVTENGLGANASLGVYVTGDETVGSGPYLAHGGFGDYFGTFNPSDPNKSRLDKIVNDRNGLFAEPSPVYGDTSTDYLIKWTSYLTKVTDKDGRLLYTDPNGQNPAVFRTLTDSFNATNQPLYYFPEGGSTGVEYNPNEPVNVELLQNYTQPSSDQPTVNANRTVILKTANTNMADNPDPNDTYIFDKGDAPGADPTRAIITRGGRGGSMITSSGKELTLSGIILDGDKDHYQVNTDGGIVNVTTGTLNISSDTVLRNSEVHNANGGAINASGNSTVNMNGAQITGCKATHDVGVGSNGGGIYVSSGVLNMTGVAQIQDCSAGNGGGIGIAKGGSRCVISDNARVVDCTADGSGGAVNVGSEGSTLTVGGNATIRNCEAANGGGINIDDGSYANFNGLATVSGCTATNSGGGLRLGSGSSVDF